jgi:TolB protein
MSAKKILLLALMLGCALPVLRTQGKPQTPENGILNITPLERIILASADVQPANPEKSAELAEAIKTFNQILWDDLSFSSFFIMANKGFYPPRPIVKHEDVNYDDWSILPFKVSYLSAGTLDLTGGRLKAELRIFDMKQRIMKNGQQIGGTPDQVRTIAHRWADEIVYQLTAGASKGIAQTKIAYSSRRGNAKNAKEIYVMDYDGYNQQAFTHNGSNNLFANWGPDYSTLAFVSYRTLRPEINIYSYTDGARLFFPSFNTFAAYPTISPDGKQLVFALRSTRGDSDLYVSKLNGDDKHNISNNPAIESSPTWSPSGKQIAFTSNREGNNNQVFICDADGSNVRRIVKEGGDADSASWSPDGKWIAFQWKPRLTSNYDIFRADVGTGKVQQLTSGGGNNENPTWAPDSRHIAFQSNRTGTTQIYILLLDGSEPRMITNQGNNTSPAWGGFFRKEAVN